MATSMLMQSMLGLALTITILLSYRVFRLLLATERRPKPRRQEDSTQTRLMIVLGSGGHTAEMLALLQNIDPLKYTHRSYVVSSGDAFSARKAEEFEQQISTRSIAVPASRKQKLQGQVDAAGSFDIAIVPRARRVYQSIWTTPFTSVLCFWACLKVLRKPKTMPPKVIRTEQGVLQRQQLGYPDLIITNGPGTGVIVVFASLALRLAGLGAGEDKMRTIYVESWARVRRLSLSGKILLRVVDRFIVQWEALVKATQGRSEYIGVLV